MNESLVAAEVNCTSQGTPSLACITECTLMPPFFFPVMGCLPTPLKIALENSVIVVESMILSRFIHSSVPLRRLSEEICTFTHGYSWIVWRHQNNHLGLNPAMNCTPKVRHKTFGVQFNYEAFIKRKTTNYSTFDCGRANQTSGEAM